MGYGGLANALRGEDRNQLLWVSGVFLHKSQEALTGLKDEQRREKMRQYLDLVLEKKEDFAIITMNVPEKLNALTDNMLHSLREVTHDLAEDEAVRAVILTGAGKAFCAGADVSTIPKKYWQGGKRQFSRFEAAKVLGWQVFDIFPRLNKPVIAAIRGACVGGGLSLALMCDIRIASETARFGAAQVSRGIVPDIGMTYYLPAVIGISRAMELMCTAEIIGAEEGEKMGLVSKIAPDNILMPEAENIARRIARQAPVAIELTKKVVWQGRFDELNRQMDLETWAQQICFGTDDHRNSVKAFLNKQPLPRFMGR